MKNEIQIYDKHEVVMFNSHCKSEAKVLSNFYPCTIEYDNILFGSTEQLFQYLIFCDNPKVQDKIVQAETPQKAKQIAKYYTPICTFPKEKQVEIMEFCLRLKNEQVPEFRNYLAKHPNDIFVEYAPWGDTFWGMDDVDKADRYVWKFGEVTGRNVVGNLIGGIRDRNKSKSSLNN